MPLQRDHGLSLGAGTEVALQERMIFEHENLGEFIRL
jgi:hypothetical protein